MATISPNTNTNFGTGTTSVVLTWSVAPSTGTIGILHVHAPAGSIGTPTGWTPLSPTVMTTSYKFAIFYKVLGASEGTITVTASGTLFAYATSFGTNVAATWSVHDQGLNVATGSPTTGSSYGVTLSGIGGASLTTAPGCPGGADGASLFTSMLVGGVCTVESKATTQVLSVATTQTTGSSDGMDGGLPANATMSELQANYTTSTTNHYLFGYAFFRGDRLQFASSNTGKSTTSLYEGYATVWPAENVQRQAGLMGGGPGSSGGYYPFQEYQERLRRWWRGWSPRPSGVLVRQM